MIKKRFLLSAGLCASLYFPFGALAQTDVFRSINENGTVEFSDRSNSATSTKFTVSKPVSVPGLSEIPDPRTFLNDQDDDAPKAAMKLIHTYSGIEILSPVQGEGGWIDGDVEVKLSLTPRLQAGHEVVVKLNGAEVASGPKLNHALPEVYRGQHTLQVSVRDTTSGATLTSDTVDFQVHRRSDKTNSRMLHPSLQSEVAAEPGNLNEILSK